MIPGVNNVTNCTVKNNNNDLYSAQLTRFLAKLVEEGLSGIRVVSAGQLEQGARLLPLLHEPQAWEGGRRGNTGVKD